MASIGAHLLEAGVPGKANPANQQALNYADYNSGETEMRQGAAPITRLNPQIELLSKFEAIHAIVDEEELPPPPPELIEGVLPVGGKMVVQGAPKTWKTWLCILLAVCVSAGMKWLGLGCEQGKVIYVNLEISKSLFMRRVFEVARAIGADLSLVKQNLVVVNGLESGANIGALVNTLLWMQGSREYSLVIIDPMYKIFGGCESEQRDVSSFFKEVDRLIEGLCCSVAVVHHYSKGFKGKWDIVDRSSGSGVIGRDMDAMVDLCRIDGPGKAMRASFVIRNYDDVDPVDYWFEYPLCKLDEKGELAACRPTNAHGDALKPTSARATVDDLDMACEELMQGKTRFKRTELVKRLGYKKPEPVNKLMAKSTRFELDTGKNYSWVVRKQGHLTM